MHSVFLHRHTNTGLINESHAMRDVCPNVRRVATISEHACRGKAVTVRQGIRSRTLLREAGGFYPEFLAGRTKYRGRACRLSRVPGGRFEARWLATSANQFVRSITPSGRWIAEQSAGTRLAGADPCGPKPACRIKLQQCSIGCKFIPENWLSARVFGKRFRNKSNRMCV